MNDESTGEERLGRLSIRAPARDEAAGSAWIELRRDSLDAPAGAFRSRLAWMALMGIAVAMIGFSARVGSFPGLGIGVFLVLLLAGIAIVRGRRPPTIVRVEDGRLRVTRRRVELDVELSSVERVGVGRDMSPLHTLWATVQTGGRVLLLDGLTAEEAELALSRLEPRLRRGKAD